MDSISNLSNPGRISASTAEILLLNKNKGQGSSKTFKPKASSVLAQVKDFLPRLAEANQILKEKVESGEGESVNIEHIDDTKESIIQMDLALVEQEDVDSEEDSDSNDESIQGEITEENIKLTPKQNHRPFIELIDNKKTDSEVHGDTNESMLGDIG